VDFFRNTVPPVLNGLADSLSVEKKKKIVRIVERGEVYSPRAPVRGIVLRDGKISDSILSRLEVSQESQMVFQESFQELIFLNLLSKKNPSAKWTTRFGSHCRLQTSPRCGKYAQREKNVESASPTKGMLGWSNNRMLEKTKTDWAL